MNSLWSSKAGARICNYNKRFEFGSEFYEYEGKALRTKILYQTVFQILNVLIRIRGSETFLYGSAYPYRWDKDPDPYPDRITPDPALFKSLGILQKSRFFF
jgi:hypothetical protein